MMMNPKIQQQMIAIITSHRCCLLSLGFGTMFVLAIDEIQDFKGCPLPEYFQKELND